MYSPSLAQHGDRTPFKPAVKHSTSALSPPPSPVVPRQPLSTRTSTRAPAVAPPASTSSPHPDPFTATASLHSTFARSIASSPVRPAPLSNQTPVILNRRPSPPVPAPDALASAAPRIRAKVTPAASPRRKPALPGAENAEPPPPPALFSHQQHQHHRQPSGSSSSVTAAPTTAGGLMGPPSTPIKRSAPVSSFQSTSHFSPPPPPRSPVSRTGAFVPTTSPFSGPSVHSFPTDFGLSNRIYELNLHSPRGAIPRRDRGKGGKDNVLVCVRVRPPAAKLANAHAIVDEVAWDVSELDGRLALKSGGPEFLFDSVVTGSENYDVYQEAGRELVLDAMEGFDAVIFAYGQTASGKTFTLSGDPSNPGIIPQSVSEIFTYIRDHPEKEFLLRASYLEIYNETLKDLLDPDAGPVKIRQDEKKRFFVHPLREEVVTTEEQVAALLRRGAENRHVGQTDFNERSSRSHSVFQMTIESRDEAPHASTFASPSPSYAPRTPNAPRMTAGGDGVVRMSRLSLIDLAGSEQATSQMERRSEGAFINKSLLTLEKVIASLTDGKKSHVPYRDSKLTQILQPSLSGDARVAVIATCNPSPAAIEETKSTLKFAQRVKKVVLKAVINEIVDDKALITKYRTHIAMLEAQLNATLSSTAPSTPSQADVAADQSRAKEMERVRDLEKQVEEFRSLFLTSNNIEQRRKSALPPRPVSPVKMPRPMESIQEDERAQFEEKLLDAQDEIASLHDERDELKARVADLEAAHLSSLEARVERSESDQAEKILELTKENNELLVIARNADVEGELKRQERKYERLLEKCRVYEEGLEANLESERRRVAQFERFILQHLTAQTDLIAGRRRSSVALAPSASITGFVPLMAESPDLDAISPAFVELDDLPFSKAGRDTINRSNSRMFPL